jgi:peptidoglycan/xylan/chitin deacetylase (PgdA/CDA1 family)
MRQRDPSILMYHHVGDKSLREVGGPFAVSEKTFQMQLSAVNMMNAEVLPVRDLFRTERPAGSRSVVLTFDDCPSALFDSALPALASRGWTATFFPVAGKVGGSNDWDLGMPKAAAQLMDWAALRELIRLGHEIGSHGTSHRNLRTMSRADALDDLKNSKDLLQQKLGIEVSTFAYPFGHVPDDYRSICMEAGYQAAVSIFSFSSTILSDRYSMRRILIAERDKGFRLRAKLSRFYLSLRPVLIDRRVLRATDTVPVQDQDAFADGEGRID